MHFAPVPSSHRPFEFVLKLGLAIAFALVPFQLSAQERLHHDWNEPPSLTVTGQGEVSTAPDSAVLRLGAVAEDKEAVNAQSRVNEIVQRALKAIQGLQLPDNKITTIGLSLSPVYEQPERPLNMAKAARIVAYRAHNTLQIQLQDLQLVGKTIDAGVAAGANQIEGLSFQLKDDDGPRRDALTLAIREARAKAETMAQAMGVRLRAVRDVTEGGVQVVHPRVDFAQTRLAMAADVATPVQPGEVRIQASVTIRYDLEQGGGTDGGRR